MKTATNLAPVEYKEISYMAEQIAEMLDWLQDLEFADEVDFDSLTSIQIVRATDRHFEGGITAFINCIS